jgi:hypothetical protein
MKSYQRYIYLFLLVLVSAMTPLLTAQTYRGGIAGTVQDATGAAVPRAHIKLVGEDTGFTREMESTSSGDYSFQDLQIGNYSITVTVQGFGTVKTEHIAVRPGQVFALDPKLSINATSESVEVSASALALDTVSSTNNNVVNEKAVANIPLNGRDYTQLIKITPGVNGAGSVNGTRTNQNNYQIDGADNNDIWQNNTAANQGGVAGIAGVTIPVEAIDQFTVQTQGNAEAGRNPGGLISLAIKTGTNNFHGSAYYYTRNEFFAARSPFTPAATRKPKLRNSQFGGSVGGPILKDKLFFFVNYERQKYTIQNSANATEPVAAYVSQANALLQKHGVAVNPLSTNLLQLWPAGGASGLAATQNNYVESTPQTGYSDNAIGNLNWNITPRQTLKLQTFIGTGRQAAVVSAPVAWYFQVAPDINQNFSLSHNWAATDHLSNQILVAVGVFNQTFNDQRHDFNMPALGLNTGVTSPSLFGAPTINIGTSSTPFFDRPGSTQPLGRKDYTGHITDVATWVHGKHQIRFGGELRRNYMDLQYQNGVRGTFLFDGTASANAVLPTGATSWSTDTTAPVEVRQLADFMSGYFTQATFLQGNLRRDIYQKNVAFFVQDQHQVLPNLSLNYGVRYEYTGALTSNGVLSRYQPGAPGADANGLILVGNSGQPATFNPGKAHFSPRIGFAWQTSEKMVLRGSYGLYFDAPAFNGFGDNSAPNGGTARGLQGNPVGNPKVQNVTVRNTQWQTNVNPFNSPSATAPSTVGLFSVDPNLKMAYSHSFGLNTEYQVSRNTLVTIGYVGALGRHLYNLLDINQPTPGAVATQQARRPVYVNKTVANWQTIGIINQVSSGGTSNYNALLASVKTSGYHGLTGQVSYTYGHSLDVISGFRSSTPQNSYNLSGDYGNADFDVRHTLNAYLVYEAPQIGHSLPLLTKGWQVNAFTTAFTGVPLTVKTGSDTSGTAESNDRVNLISGAAFKTSTNTSLIPATSSTAAPFAQIFNRTAFSNPAQGIYGNTARGQFRGPGFFTFDTSLVKNTQLHEGVSLQLRAEMFNLFNHVNLANPSVSNPVGSATFGRSTNTRNNGSAPGIGPGEPFNVQLAGKIIF